MSTGTNFSITPPPQTDPITSDNMINGMIGNEGIVGVVKRHKKGDHGRLSNQGSGREEAHLRSSSSSSGDDDEIHDKRRRKGQRKPRHTIFPIDDEDDERTDSASEGMEIDTSDTQHIKGYNLQLAKFPTTHPAASILKPLSPMLTVGYGGDLVVSHTTHHQDSCGTPTLDSPHNSDGHVSSSGILSPEISIAPQVSKQVYTYSHVKPVKCLHLSFSFHRLFPSPNRATYFINHSFPCVYIKNVCQYKLMNITFYHFVTMLNIMIPNI